MINNSSASVCADTADEKYAWLTAINERCCSESTVLSLFEEVVTHHPERCALIFEDTEWSYAQLDREAERIAHLILTETNADAAFVGICADNCALAIAAMLGVMKTGLAFVPIDPDTPPKRMQSIVDSAPLPLVLATAEHSQLFKEVNCRVLTLENNATTGEKVSSVRAKATPGETQLAYMMYTSGSTGEPKGVLIEHRAFLTYVLADIAVFSVQPDDSCLQFSTLSFDLAFEEIFPQLLMGACVVIRPRQSSKEAIELSAIIGKHAISIVHIATAYWHEWVDLMHILEESVPDSLRMLVVTGEQVSLPHYKRWLEVAQHPVQWANAYGPTEATVSASVFFADKDFSGDTIPIGRALPGYELYVLDANYNVVDAGIEGELYIAGSALARGYHKREDLTAAAFLDVHVNSASTTTRLYKTGDRVYRGADDYIYFLGRVDQQVKIGSFRVEPKEVEAALLQCQSVREALVLVDNTDGIKQLVAFVLGDNEVLSEVSIREALALELPAYMLPGQITILDRFPKTISGKVDRQKLISDSRSRVMLWHDDLSEFENTVKEIWQGELGAQTVGRDSDLFDMGGSSIVALRVLIACAQRFAIRITMEEIMNYSTLSSFAGLLESKLKGTTNTSLPAEGYSESFFFGEPDRQLYGVYHPPGARAPARGSLLIVPPIGQEYDRSHWSLRQLALEAAKQGYHVLRFDFFGTGDSAGAFSELTADSMIRDIESAIEKIVSLANHNTLSIVGVRVGGLLASHVAALMKLKTVNQCITWDVFQSGSAFLGEIQQHVARTASQQGYNFITANGGLSLNGYVYEPSLLESFNTVQWQRFQNNRELHSVSMDERQSRTATIEAGTQVAVKVDWNGLEPQVGTVFLLKPFIAQTLSILRDASC